MELNIFCINNKKKTQTATATSTVDRARLPTADDRHGCGRARVCGGPGSKLGIGGLG